MPKMFNGWCPICEKETVLTTMDKPIGSACRCTACQSGLGVSGKNQIMTVPFFIAVCYLIIYLPTQGRVPTGLELLLGFLALLLFTLYNKKFVVYKPMEPKDSGQSSE